LPNSGSGCEAPSDPLPANPGERFETLEAAAAVGGQRHQGVLLDQVLAVCRVDQRGERQVAQAADQRIQFGFTDLAQQRYRALVGGHDQRQTPGIRQEHQTGGTQAAACALLHLAKFHRQADACAVERLDPGFVGAAAGVDKARRRFGQDAARPPFELVALRVEIADFAGGRRDLAALDPFLDGAAALSVVAPFGRDAVEIAPVLVFLRCPAQVLGAARAAAVAAKELGQLGLLEQQQDTLGFGDASALDQQARELPVGISALLRQGVAQRLVEPACPGAQPLPGVDRQFVMNDRLVDADLATVFLEETAKVGRERREVLDCVMVLASSLSDLGITYMPYASN